MDDLGKVSEVLGIPSIRRLMETSEKRTLTERLVALVKENGTLFTTPAGTGFVSVGVDGHVENYALDSEDFDLWLRGFWYESEKRRVEEEAEAAYESLLASLGPMAEEERLRSLLKIYEPSLIKEQTMKDTIMVLKSLARSLRNVQEVFIRVAEDGGRYYLDLANDEHEAVEVDATGWRIIKDPPVRFLRVPGMLPLPRPTTGGDLDELRNLLNMGEEASTPTAPGELMSDARRNWILSLTWLAQCARYPKQHPILAVKGAEGSAKSTTAYILRSTIDPNDAPDDPPPASLRDMCITVEHLWVYSLDNVSSISPWQSDALAKLVYGGGMRVRALWTNKGLIVFKARRPIILNGISDLGTRKDLLSRTLTVSLPVISKYQLEQEVLERFEKKHPRILGALLTAISAGMKKMPTLEKVVGRGTRLADFDLWGRAVAEALGFSEEEFLQARRLADEEASHIALEAAVAAPSIARLLMHYREDDPLVATSTGWLERVNNIETDPDKKRHCDWPKSPDSMGRLLATLQSSLRGVGFVVEKTTFLDGDGKKQRGWKGYYIPPDRGRDTSEDGGDTSVPQSVPDETPIDKGNAEDRDTRDTSSGGEDDDDLDLIDDEEEVEEDDRAKRAALDAINADEELTRLFTAIFRKRTEHTKRQAIDDLGAALAGHFSDHPQPDDESLYLWRTAAREMVKESEGRKPGGEE